ncbi:hypothetical protein ABKN59_007540 [Abortiporus biennis]
METISAVNICIVIATVLCYYDYTLTFSDEWRCIWKRRYSGATVCFFINRYFTLIYISLLLVNFVSFGPVPSDSAHKLFILIQLNFSAIMCLRLYAMWSRSIKILVIFALLGIIPQIIRIYLYTQTSHFKPMSPPYTGCSVWIAIPAYAIFYDALILATTWIKTANIRELLGNRRMLNSNHSVVTYLLCDGTLYFLSLMVLNATTLIGIKSLTTGGVPLISDVMASILISRFMLNLRAVYMPDDNLPSSFHPSKMSDLHFASTSIVGNLGAPLEVAPAGLEGDDIHMDEMEGLQESMHESSNPLSVDMELFPSSYQSKHNKHRVETSSVTLKASFRTAQTQDR